MMEKTKQIPITPNKYNKLMTSIIEDVTLPIPEKLIKIIEEASKYKIEG